MMKTDNAHKMNRGYHKGLGFLLLLLIALGSTGCEKFFEPDQEFILREEQFFNDWYDYRAAEMGMYGIQQDLVEQLLFLGELRADLMQVTNNATRDMLEVQNFEISAQNVYASPRNFYKLIAACNNLQRTLENYHPEVLDPDSPISNYDRLFGEVILMRSWAYFNAVRIYRQIPWIPVSMTNIDEIVEFINTPKTVVDSFDIIYHPDGIHNDTIWFSEPRQWENAYMELPDIVDSCAHQILTDIKAAGVNHYVNNDDKTWEVTIWNEYAMYYLLGQMYFYKGDLSRAMIYFDKILRIVDLESSNIRYGLDRAFQRGNWKRIHSSININEHIFVVWFGKSHRQTNSFQQVFSIVPPNKYQIKPTTYAVHLWETIWDNWRLLRNPPLDPADMTLRDGYPGIPGDFHRGHNVSYAYITEERAVAKQLVIDMMELKRNENDFEVAKLMEGLDTVIYKYTLGRENDPFAADANFIVARAASVHLYAAEIYARWANRQLGDDFIPTPNIAEQYLNDGSYQGNGDQLGVRGRVGFADNYEYITVQQETFYHRDPFTNRVVDYSANVSLAWKQNFLEDEILKERGRELAFEGERFYDLMRIAQRRGDPSYLADRVASKFSGAEAEAIRTKLMDENNWYLPFYLGVEGE